MLVQCGHPCQNVGCGSPCSAPPSPRAPADFATSSLICGIILENERRSSKPDSFLPSGLICWNILDRLPSSRGWCPVPNASSMLPAHTDMGPGAKWAIPDSKLPLPKAPPGGTCDHPFLLCSPGLRQQTHVPGCPFSCRPPFCPQNGGAHRSHHVIGPQRPAGGAASALPQVAGVAHLPLPAGGQPHLGAGQPPAAGPAQPPPHQEDQDLLGVSTWHAVSGVGAVRLSREGTAVTSSACKTLYTWCMLPSQRPASPHPLWVGAMQSPRERHVFIANLSPCCPPGECHR